MIDKERLEQQLAELPLYVYHFLTPDQLEFSDRIRWISPTSTRPLPPGAITRM